MTTATAGSPWTCRLELLPLQNRGGAGLLSIMTAGAKLVHPSHLLSAVQLISRSQEFLSGLEQHPKASKPIAIARAANTAQMQATSPFSCPPSLMCQDSLDANVVLLLPAISLEARGIITLFTGILHLDNTTRLQKSKSNPECWLLQLNSKS